MPYIRLVVATLAAASLAYPAFAGIPVSGRVLDSEGTPLRDAKVALIPSLDAYERSLHYLEGRRHPPPTVEVRSDRQGFYALEAPEPGLWLIEISSPGHVVQRHEFSPLFEAVNLPPVALPADRGLALRVTDTRGQPLAGARVFAVRDSSRRPQPGWQSSLSYGLTDEEGRVSIPWTPNERTRIRALAPGHLESSILELSAGEEPRGPLSLKLEPGVARTIEVHDSSGRRQPKIMVYLGEWGITSGLTDDDGRFEITVPRKGNVLLDVIADDGRRREERLAHDGEPDVQDATPRVVVLPDLLEVSGRIIDATTREGVAGALVALRNYRGLLTRADRAGRYTLRFALRNLRLSVTAIAPGYFQETATMSRSPIPVEGPTLALKPATAIEGMLVDADAQPVAGALLRLKEAQQPPISLSRRRPGREAAGASDAEGRFRIRLVRPHATYDLEVFKPEFAPYRDTVTAPGPGDAGSLEPIVLSRGQRGFGFVLDMDSRGIAGAQVTLERPPAPPVSVPGVGYSAPTQEPVVVTRATSDAEGRFELTQLPPGRFDLRFTATGFAPLVVSDVEIPEGVGEMDLGAQQLEPGADITGRVVDPDGGSVGWGADPDPSGGICGETRCPYEPLRPQKAGSGANGRRRDVHRRRPHPRPKLQPLRGRRPVGRNPRERSDGSGGRPASDAAALRQPRRTRDRRIRPTDSTDLGRGVATARSREAGVRTATTPAHRCRGALRAHGRDARLDSALGLGRGTPKLREKA